MFKNNKKIKVRLAPSPTGFLHIGTARTGLFNYLFSKKNKGEFILRIEDTDKERSKPEYEKDIIKGLEWLGINWDTGPIHQSERLKIHQKYLKELLEKKQAFYCFCTTEELEVVRQEQINRGEAPKYNGKCADLSKKEIEQKLKDNERFVIRFKTPNKKVTFVDLIRGEVEFDSSLFGDFVIAKSFNDPLYNFVVVIDDNDMEISHIIRGEDHIPNTPKQILIQEALGFKQPKYAHLPLILGSDRSKLSKRHGAVSLLEYRELGFLPEAMVNFMALLGWNPDTEKEIFSLKELSKYFSFNAIQKGGAIFDMQKLEHINGIYIRQKSLEELLDLSLPFLQNADLIGNKNIDREKLKKIISLYKERIKKLSELPELTEYFFKENIEYPKELLQWKKMTKEDIKNSLDILENILSEINDKNFNKENLEKILMKKAEEMGDRGKLLWPMRVALTGQKASADPFDVAVVLGKQETLKRINKAKLMFK